MRCADGSIEFDSGDVAMQFSVVDAGGPQLVVRDAGIAFADISLEASGSRLSWLYNALLVLFHDQIVTRIQDRMNDALHDDVPAKLNSYLAALPSTVRVPVRPPLQPLCLSVLWYLCARWPPSGGPACLHASHANTCPAVEGQATTAAFP